MDLNNFGPCKSYEPVGRKANALCGMCWYPRTAHTSFFAKSVGTTLLIGFLTFMVIA